MEQGNEGDEIILLALRQIECSLGDDIKSIGQLGPDSLVEIFARSLWLISQGEIKFPVSLPPNIASKHRICTDMAAKIKELGFTGDCGYNQILYPTESHTRSLLNWLVQKLPRSDDTGAEAVLGGNALLNKRIMDSVARWKSLPWRIHCCASPYALQNYYLARPATTSPRMHDGILAVCQTTSQTHQSISTSVFERHAAALVRDQEYAARLESDFADEDANSTGKHIVHSAFAGVKGSNFSTVATTRTVGNATSDSREAELMGKSLVEIISGISAEKDDSDSPKKQGRGTRFTHSTEFAQENTASLLVSSGENSVGKAPSSTQSVVGTPKPNDRSAASDVPTSVSGPDGSLTDLAKARIEQRKAQQEEEEKQLLREIEDAREAAQTAEAAVEEHERVQNNTSSKTRQLENEILSLQQDGDRLEREIKLKRKTLEMLPSAADNIGKLQTICANSAKRLMQLAQEWESHRRPLVDKLRDLKSSKTRRRAKCRTMVEDMKRCREEMVAMVQDLKDKQEKSQHLAEEVSKLPRNINRTLYTYRIMDIIASIGKQNKEIAKITADIREVQKTINSSNNILTRADAVAEERIYTAANGPHRTPAMVEAYRNLTALRAKFELLVETINKIGQLDKQARDLETKVDQEVARVSANNFDRIRADLEEVQKDNQNMIAQLKALRARAQ